MESHMQSFIVLLPPVLVLLVAIVWRNVIAALFTGIISSAFIATHYSFSETIKLTIYRIFQETHIDKLWAPGESPDHLYTFVFLITLGIIISLITHTGGIAAYTRIIQKRLTNSRQTQTTSLVLSLLFFIDDYLNSLTVGCIMRPLTDKFKIPRAKLAFLIDSMSSPLCVLVPATSWVAMIIANLQVAGVEESVHSDIYGDPFAVYLQSIPFMFYPLLIMISALFIVRKNISFGPMYRQEEIAHITGNLFGGKPAIQLRVGQECPTGSPLDFFIPIGTFILSVITIILTSGKWIVLGGNRSLMQAIQEANIFYALCFASIITLTLSLILFLWQKKVTPEGIKEVAMSGFLLMKNSLIVLLLAWTLSTMLKSDLHTGQYLAHLLLGTMPSYLLALTIFLTSTAIASSTGSAWGTVMIMMPLSIPMVIAYTQGSIPFNPENVPMLYPVLGALLSGAIAGGHVSPISDSTVMSATSAGCYHLDHLTTQIPYMTPAFIGTIIAYILSGLFSQYGLITGLASSAVAIAITLTLLYIRNQND